MNRVAAVSISILLAAAFTACKSVEHTETGARSTTTPSKASAASLTSPAAAPDDDLFVNGVLGFSARKPPSWHFGPTAWDEANLDQLEFKDDEFAELVLENASEPLVVILKYDDTADALSPTFRATFRPLGQLSDLSPQQIAEMLIPQLGDSFSAFELVDGIAHTEVSELPAARFASSFTVDDLAGATHAILTETWLVKRGDYLFILEASAPREDPSLTDLRAILRSIVIDPRLF